MCARVRACGDSRPLLAALHYPNLSYAAPSYIALCCPVLSCIHVYMYIRHVSNLGYCTVAADHSTYRCAVVVQWGRAVDSGVCRRSRSRRITPGHVMSRVISCQIRSHHVLYHARSGQVKAGQGKASRSSMTLADDSRQQRKRGGCDGVVHSTHALQHSSRTHTRA